MYIYSVTDITPFFFSYNFPTVIPIIPLLALFPEHLEFSYSNLITLVFSSHLQSLSTWICHNLATELQTPVFIWLGHSQVKSKSLLNNFISPSIHFPQFIFLEKGSFPLRYQAGDFKVSKSWEDPCSGLRYVLVFNPNHIWLNTFCGFSLCIG